MIGEEYFDLSQNASLIAYWEEQRRGAVAVMAALATGTGPGWEEQVRYFPVLVSQAVISHYQKTDEGQLIRAVTLPSRDIIAQVPSAPSFLAVTASPHNLRAADSFAFVILLSVM